MFTVGSPAFPTMSARKMGRIIVELVLQGDDFGVLDR
jgi:hypothetical protein